MNAPLLPEVAVFRESGLGLHNNVTIGTEAENARFIEALEKAFDRLHGMVQRVRARQAIALPEHIISRIEMILDGREDELLAVAAGPGEARA